MLDRWPNDRPVESNSYPVGYVNVVRNAVIGAVASALLLLGLAAPAGAANVQLVGTFSEPVYVTSDPTDANRLFVVQKSGEIVVVRNGSKHTFLDLARRQRQRRAGPAVDRVRPRLRETSRLFVYYIDKAAGNIHVVELQATANGATRPEPICTKCCRSTTRPSPTTTAGNCSSVPTATSSSPPATAAAPTTAPQRAEPGKPARQDPAHRPDPPVAHTVPADNPFPAATPALIWASGCATRSASPSTRPAARWIGDVGQSACEEIDFAAAPGARRRGQLRLELPRGELPDPPRDPECADHDERLHPADLRVLAQRAPRRRRGCAITGGYIVRDPSLGPSPAATSTATTAPASCAPSIRPRPARPTAARG